MRLGKVSVTGDSQAGGQRGAASCPSVVLGKLVAAPSQTLFIVQLATTDGKSIAWPAILSSLQ